MLIFSSISCCFALFVVFFVLFNMKAENRKQKKEQKKQAKKDEIEKAKASKALIDAAYAVEDHLESWKAFKKYQMQGLDLVIEYSPVRMLSAELLQWAFDLTKTNMQTLYEETWGWSDKHKWNEMNHSEALYLVALEKQGRKPVGFAHFRFCFEDDKNTEVLYLYEIQVEKDYQSKGVGKFLMMILELIGSKNEMKFIMMTVFKINTRAMDFYQKKLKYVIDSTSPSVVDLLSDEPHEVLSKPLRTMTKKS